MAHTTAINRAESAAIHRRPEFEARQLSAAAELAEMIATKFSGMADPTTNVLSKLPSTEKVDPNKIRSVLQTEGLPQEEQSILLRLHQQSPALKLTEDDANEVADHLALLMDQLLDSTESLPTLMRGLSELFAELASEERSRSLDIQRRYDLPPIPSLITPIPTAPPVR